MSRRTDELEAQVGTLRRQLEDALREVAEVSGANGQLASKLDDAQAALIRAHESRSDAWKQVIARDEQIITLTAERDTAIAAVEAMAAEDQKAGFGS